MRSRLLQPTGHFMTNPGASILSYQGLRLSKGRYDETFAGEDGGIGLATIFRSFVAEAKGSLTLAMGKCLWFSVKIKVCQSSLYSPQSYPELSTLWL